jgi:hypothetical protein
MQSEDFLGLFGFCEWILFSMAYLWLSFGFAVVVSSFLFLVLLLTAPVSVNGGSRISEHSRIPVHFSLFVGSLACYW